MVLLCQERLSRILSIAASILGNHVLSPLEMPAHVMTPPWRHQLAKGKSQAGALRPFASLFRSNPSLSASKEEVR